MIEGEEKGARRRGRGGRGTRAKDAQMHISILMIRIDVSAVSSLVLKQGACDRYGIMA